VFALMALIEYEKNHIAYSLVLQKRRLKLFVLIMDYVLTGAYKTQPNFQRYIEHKSDKLREQGITVDIWK
jgi:DNA-binding LacI/PurR family transcriptional regulator